MEREENTNLWANRLQEIPLPESEQAWMAMEKLLDKELPPVNRIPRNYRVLGMVAPVLALIIGYVVVHGRHQTAGSAQGKQARPEPPVLESVRAAKRQDAEQKNQPFHKGSVAPDRESIRSSSGSIRPVDRQTRRAHRPRPGVVGLMIGGTSRSRRNGSDVTRSIGGTERYAGKKTLCGIQFRRQPGKAGCRRYPGPAV